jgi:hypothetical protein
VSAAAGTEGVVAGPLVNYKNVPSIAEEIVLAVSDAGAR